MNVDDGLALHENDPSPAANSLRTVDKHLARLVV